MHSIYIPIPYPASICICTINDCKFTIMLQHTSNLTKRIHKIRPVINGFKCSNPIKCIMLIGQMSHITF